MGAWHRGWIVFGGTIGMVFLFVVSSVMWPTAYVMYCTAGFETCMTSGRSQPWHVVETPCPAGQSLRFVRPVLSTGCHSISVPGFSTPLSVCPAACVK